MRCLGAVGVQDAWLSAHSWQPHYFCSRLLRREDDVLRASPQTHTTNLTCACHSRHSLLAVQVLQPL